MSSFHIRRRALPSCGCIYATSISGALGLVPVCSPLRLLLCRSGLCLGSLLSVALDHDDAEERPHDCRSQQNENDGNANGPDARGEEVLERVVGIDKGLARGLSENEFVFINIGGKSFYHEQSPEGVVEENNRGSHEHGGAYEFVELRSAKEMMLAIVGIFSRKGMI